VSDRRCGRVSCRGAKESSERLDLYKKGVIFDIKLCVSVHDKAAYWELITHCGHIHAQPLIPDSTPPPYTSPHTHQSQTLPHTTLKRVGRPMVLGPPNWRGRDRYCKRPVLLSILVYKSNNNRKRNFLQLSLSTNYGTL